MVLDPRQRLGGPAAEIGKLAPEKISRVAPGSGGQEDPGAGTKGEGEEHRKSAGLDLVGGEKIEIIGIDWHMASSRGSSAALTGRADVF
jgi:hypothetical protein